MYLFGTAYKHRTEPRTEMGRFWVVAVNIHSSEIIGGHLFSCAPSPGIQRGLMKELLKYALQPRGLQGPGRAGALTFILQESLR